jgi:uncharacterized protein
MNNLSWYKQWPLLACVLLLSACLAPTATNTLYALQTIHQEPMGREFSDFEGIILVMPVQLAPHLQGRGLVSQRSSGEARTSATHLWAGPLDQQIGQQIAVHLKNLLATDNVAVYPGPRFGVIRYQLEVEMSEFSGNDRSFTAIAVYTISDTVARTIISRKTFHQTWPMDTPDYSGYVENASQAIADLSKEAAAVLLTARRSQTAPSARP